MQAQAVSAPGVPTVVSEVVLESTKTTFSSICGGDCSILSAPRDDQKCAGVMGVISFVGDQSFTFALVLPEPTAVTLSEKFAGFAIPFDSPDMGDVVGELANVVAGDIVARMDTRGVKVQLSLPTVMRGHDVELLLPGSLPSLRMYFSTAEGGFWLKLVAARPGMFPTRRAGS